MTKGALVQSPRYGTVVRVQGEARPGALAEIDGWSRPVRLVSKVKGTARLFRYELLEDQE